MGVGRFERGDTRAGTHDSMIKETRWQYSFRPWVEEKGRDEPFGARFVAFEPHVERSPLVQNHEVDLQQVGSYRAHLQHLVSHHWAVGLLDLAKSGDTADRARIVSYRRVGKPCVDGGIGSSRAICLEPAVDDGWAMRGLSLDPPTGEQATQRDEHAMAPKHQSPPRPGTPIAGAS